MMGKYIFPLAVVSLVYFSSGALASTYYVSTGGSDLNPGTSSQPWVTLQHAVDSIAQGDTISVNSGSYAGFRVENSALPGAVKTIRADLGASMVVHAPGPINRHSGNIEFENFDASVKYWVIDGFEVADSPKFGIDLRDTDYITVQNCFVRDSALTGIFTAFTYYPL
jgi:hypothetical protein